MQPPLSHWNWKAEQTGQFSSSLPSSHSEKPSHRQAIGIQSISPVEQVNCSVEQVGGSERETEGNICSQYVDERTEYIDLSLRCVSIVAQSDCCRRPHVVCPKGGEIVWVVLNCRSMASML